MYVLFERFYAALLLFRLYSNAITCYSALLPLIPMYVLFERFCAILLLFPSAVIPLFFHVLPFYSALLPLERFCAILLLFR